MDLQSNTLKGAGGGPSFSNTNSKRNAASNHFVSWGWRNGQYFVLIARERCRHL
jgi:hypothetical protein